MSKSVVENYSQIIIQFTDNVVLFVQYQYRHKFELRRLQFYSRNCKVSVYTFSFKTSNILLKNVSLFIFENID